MSTCRRTSFLVIVAGTVVLGGCASGNTSSFTQAPLFFSDEVAPDGTATDVTQQTAAADIVAGDFAAGIPTYLTVGGNAVLPVNRVVLDVATAAGPGGIVTGTTANVGQLGNAGLTTEVRSGSVAVGVNGGLPVLGGTSLGVGTAVTGVLPTTPATAQPSLAASLGGSNLAVTAPVTLGVVPLGSALATVGPVLGRATAVPIAQTLPNSLIQTTSTTLTRACLLKKC